MRLYNASSITPLAVPPSTGSKYKAPKNYVPEQPIDPRDRRRLATMLTASHRLDCQSPLPKSFKNKQQGFSGPTLSELASTSSTSAALGYWPAIQTLEAFRFDIDDAPKQAAVWISDDETFSRSTSSTISSFASVDPARRANSYGIKPSDARQGSSNLKSFDAAGDESSFAAGPAWWEGGASTASSPQWQVRYPKKNVQDLRSRPPTPYNHAKSISMRKGSTHRGYPSTKSRETPGRFLVSTYDGWETFSSRFDHDAVSKPPTKDRVPENSLQRQKVFGNDGRKHPYGIQASLTATTCDTSDSSSEETPVGSGKAVPPFRRVPILLGHILEEKYQQARRFGEAKTTIDEIGFPLSARSQDSMMLIMKDEDDSCRLATTFVRATSGQWSEIVTL